MNSTELTSTNTLASCAKPAIKRVRSVSGHLVLVLDPQLAFRVGIDEETKIEESLTEGGILLKVHSRGAGK
jgi:hypothetical protein